MKSSRGRGQSPISAGFRRGLFRWEFRGNDTYLLAAGGRSGSLRIWHDWRDRWSRRAAPHHSARYQDGRINCGNRRQPTFFKEEDEETLAIIRRHGRTGRPWAGPRFLARLGNRLSRRLRTSIHTGRPLASDAFLAKVERALGRRLRPLSVGRPAKAAKGGPK